MWEIYCLPSFPPPWRKSFPVTKYLEIKSRIPFLSLEIGGLVWWDPLGYYLQNNIFKNRPIFCYNFQGVSIAAIGNVCQWWDLNMAIGGMIPTWTMPLNRRELRSKIFVFLQFWTRLKAAFVRNIILLGEGISLFTRNIGFMVLVNCVLLIYFLHQLPTQPQLNTLNQPSDWLIESPCCKGKTVQLYRAGG